MKLKLAMTAASAAAVLSLAISLGHAQPQSGAETLLSKSIPSNPAAEQALAEALTGPDGEYAAQALYEGLVQKFGDVLPYATIVDSEARHANALKRHLEMRGLAIPENPHRNTLPLPATLKEAADSAIAAEERNIAMYDRLLEQVKDQPDLVQLFSRLQWASREHHLVAFRNAAASDGSLAAGELGCAATGMRGAGLRGGPPAWARGGGRGRGGQARCCPLCTVDGSEPAPAGMRAGKRQGRGWGAGPRVQ